MQVTIGSAGVHLLMPEPIPQRFVDLFPVGLLAVYSLGSFARRGGANVRRVRAEKLGIKS
jgi:hypothetical protein